MITPLIEKKVFRRTKCFDILILFKTRGARRSSRCSNKFDPLLLFVYCNLIFRIYKETQLN